MSEMKIDGKCPEFTSWIAGAQQILDDDHRKNGYKFTPDVLDYKVNKKYIKIIRTTSQRSVFCFIDRSNGDILKGAVGMLLQNMPVETYSTNLTVLVQSDHMDQHISNNEIAERKIICLRK